MKVYGIFEGVLENTYRYGDPGIHRFDVCESGFLSEGEAAQSLIDTGWTNDVPRYVKAAIGGDAWVRPEDEEREMGEDFRPVERVRYIFEMEVDALMPEEGAHFAHGGYISADGINWEPIGNVDESTITFLPEHEDVTNWSEVLLELQKPQRYTITFPWWQDYHALYEQIFGIPYRARYTVPMLRRNGKSHKGRR